MTLFTPDQLTILRLFQRPGIVNMDRMLCALYEDDPDGGPVYAQTCVRVQVARLRKKLIPFGIAILTIGRGVAAQGYALDPSHLAALKRLLADRDRLEIEFARCNGNMETVNAALT